MGHHHHLDELAQLQQPQLLRRLVCLVIASEIKRSVKFISKFYDINCACTIF